MKVTSIVLSLLSWFKLELVIYIQFIIKKIEKEEII